MEQLRVLFWGYDKTAENSLTALLSFPNVKVVGVVVPANREALMAYKIQEMARNENASIYCPKKLSTDEEFLKTVKQLSPDLYIVDSYSMLVPKDFLDLPTIGAFNIHPGKLPVYRGAHVLNWALINGESEIVVTVHHMTEQFDTGDIVLEKTFKVSFLDTISTVFDKVSQVNRELVKLLITSILDGTLQRIPQNEQFTRHYRARKPEDGLIDWNMTNIEIYNLVRALVPPWPGAFFCKDGEKIIINEACPVSFTNSEQPGTVIAKNSGSFCVATGYQCLLIKKASRMDFSPGEMLKDTD